MDFVKSPYSIFRHDVLKQVFVVVFCCFNCYNARPISSSNRETCYFSRFC